MAFSPAAASIPSWISPEIFVGATATLVLIAGFLLRGSPRILTIFATLAAANYGSLRLSGIDASFNDAVDLLILPIGWFYRELGLYVFDPVPKYAFCVALPAVLAYLLSLLFGLMTGSTYRSYSKRR